MKGNAKQIADPTTQGDALGYMLWPIQAITNPERAEEISICRHRHMKATNWFAYKNN